MPPRAAYIHVPFCRHRCGYCNFTVIARREDLIPAYLAGLEQELSLLESPREVDTLFLGGGTPTHLSPPDLDRLLRLVRHWFPSASALPLTDDAASHAEFSLEANPRDITPERVEVLRENRVNRLSLGAQSFAARKLSLLERDHDAGIIAEALALGRRFARSVSLDLIFGAPGESLADWERDLEAALALAPDHISTYGLTFERGTRFWSRQLHGELVSAPEELERAMYLAAIDRLTAAGFEHYEVSNFAKPGHRSLHNETYWRGGEYFAAGPGASRYVARTRETNHRSTTAWLERLRRGVSPVAERESISAEEATRERVVFGLRMREGIDLAEIRAATGVDAAHLLARAFARCQEMGAIERAGNRVRLTHAGLLISDSLWPQFWASAQEKPESAGA